ncbi:MAG: type II toxin-antitoxin system HicA family toxin [Candidatus Riflebacteria bacterium]|nr:type II toxin-antitoxin system HicA family toxin [Candidatus Riflebacteria bacterium]
MKVREVIKKLEQNGWILRRIKGSHHIYSKNGVSVPVPFHGNKELGKGLLKAIEKQTGVKL